MQKLFSLSEYKNRDTCSRFLSLLRKVYFMRAVARQQIKFTGNNCIRKIKGPLRRSFLLRFLPENVIFAAVPGWTQTRIYGIILTR